jgi:hypothetical protein
MPGQSPPPRDEFIQVDDRCPPSLGLPQAPPGRARISRRIHLHHRQSSIQRPGGGAVHVHVTQDASQRRPGPTDLVNEPRRIMVVGSRWRALRNLPGRVEVGKHEAPHQDRRAISVQLTTVLDGQRLCSAGSRTGWSGGLSGCIGQLPKLIMRVRFSSPAPPGNPSSGQHLRSESGSVWVPR